MLLLQEEFESPYTNTCSLLQTNSKITKFSNPSKEPKPGDKVKNTLKYF
jgi:hypothetical protein